jgi:hypothetical protein
MADTTKIAGRLVADLMSELDLTREQALGLVGNLAHESAGFKTLQEVGGGGFGYAQWTGPRRTEFKQFASARGLKPTSYEANRDFIVKELKGKERAALRQIKSAKTAEQAATVAMKSYFRPGVPHLDRRIDYTNQFAASLQNSAIDAINRVAPTVPPRRPDSASQSSLLPATRVRTVPINPQTGGPVNFPSLRNSATRRDIGAIAPAPAPSPRPQSSAPAMFGDSSPAALSVTSRLGSRPDFSDSVAAPRYGDYDAARDLAARRYSTPPTVSRQPSQLAATTQMPPSVRPRTIAPTSTAPSPPALPGGGQQPISFAEAARRAALRDSEGAQIVGQGVPSLQQLTSGFPAEAPRPTIKRLVNVPNVGPAIIFNATAPDAGDPRRLNTQPLDIPPARSPAVPVGPSFPLRGGGALNGAPPNYGNYRASMRRAPMLPSGGQDIPNLDSLGLDDMGAQRMADSRRGPVAANGRVYYPGGRAPAAAGGAAPRQQAQKPTGLFGGLFGGNGGLFGGGMFGGGQQAPRNAAGLPIAAASGPVINGATYGITATGSVGDYGSSPGQITAGLQPGERKYDASTNSWGLR